MATCRYHWVPTVHIHKGRPAVSHRGKTGFVRQFTPTSRLFGPRAFVGTRGACSLASIAYPGLSRGLEGTASARPEAGAPRHGTATPQRRCPRTARACRASGPSRLARKTTCSALAVAPGPRMASTARRTLRQRCGGRKMGGTLQPVARARARSMRPRSRSGSDTCSPTRRTRSRRSASPQVATALRSLQIYLRH